jgi:hypothetical protein
VSVSTVQILPHAPVEWDAATSWRAYLEEQFAWAQREARLELESQHPGARHRVAELLRLGANILGDLEELDATVRS